MSSEMQRDVNVMLLRCIVDSQKAMVGFVNYAIANKDDAEAAKESYNALSEKLTASFDRCIDLIEKADK